MERLHVAERINTGLQPLDRESAFGALAPRSVGSLEGREHRVAKSGARHRFDASIRRSARHGFGPWVVRECPCVMFDRALLGRIRSGHSVTDCSVAEEACSEMSVWRTEIG